MPRKRRFFLPRIPVHVVQRSKNRQAVFFEDNDYHAYLSWLGESACEHGCSIHAYVLMTKHIHLLVTPAAGRAVSAMLQALGRRLEPYINHSYGRTGTLWEGRFKANPVHEEGYLLTCYRYIELNPVGAGIVDKPDDYPWSSYHANALGAYNPLVSPHSIYLALGGRSLRAPGGLPKPLHGPPRPQRARLPTDRHPARERPLPCADRAGSWH